MKKKYQVFQYDHEMSMCGNPYDTMAEAVKFVENFPKDYMGSITLFIVEVWTNRKSQ